MSTLSDRERRWCQFLVRWLGWTMAGAHAAMLLSIDDYDRHVQAFLSGDHSGLRSR